MSGTKALATQTGACLRLKLTIPLQKVSASCAARYGGGCETTRHLFSFPLLVRRLGFQVHLESIVRDSFESLCLRGSLPRRSSDICLVDMGRGHTPTRGQATPQTQMRPRKYPPPL